MKEETVSIKEELLPVSTVEDICTVYVQGTGSTLENTCTVYVHGVGSTVEVTCIVYVQRESIKRERIEMIIKVRISFFAVKQNLFFQNNDL